MDYVDWTQVVQFAVYVELDSAANDSVVCLRLITHLMRSRRCKYLVTLLRLRAKMKESIKRRIPSVCCCLSSAGF